MISVALAGDVMLGRGVNEALAAGLPPPEVWGDLLPLLGAADLRIVNLECAVTAHRQPWPHTPKVFHFRADPRALAVLTQARIDAVSLANNHTLDFDFAGLADTLRHLDAAGIGHAGAGRNRAEAVRPALRDAAGRRVGLLAFTDNEPPFAATADRPGTAYLPVSLAPAVLGEVESAIAAARAAGAELIVFSNHWGPNLRPRPNSLFRRFAHAVIDRGADLYFGHSAHVFQGVELYHGKPILYDAGDFLDDYAVDPVLRNDWSFLFQALFAGNEFRQLELAPVKLSFARVRLAGGSERQAILERMRGLSAELGTRLEETPRGLRLGS